MTKPVTLKLTTSFDVVRIFSPGIDRCHVLKYQDLANKLLRNEGSKSAIKVLKGYYLIATRVAMRQPFEPLPFRRSSKDGFPKDLNPWKSLLLSEDYRSRQGALTILRSYALLYGPLDYSTESITAPGPNIHSESWHPTWITFLDRWSKKFSKPKLGWDRSELLGSTKSGPNGPSLLAAHIDALALKDDTNLWKHFVSYNLLMKQETLTEYVTDLYQTVLDTPVKSKPRHSKLSFLREGGGKTRVVAIGDYFTREALKGLHRHILDLLKKLRTDGTYDQNRIAVITRDKTLSKSDIYCFDLSSATDRFPVLLQEELLSRIIGPEAAKAWRSLVSDRYFRTPYGDVKYSVGQPMGLFTSWPIFALTHHAFVEFAAHLCGFHHFEEYVILGDDIAIFNEDVAVQYERLLNSIKVPISKEKSTISRRGNLISSGEIAKRLFVNGIEISPVPPDIIMKARSSVMLFPMLIRVMLARGIEVSPLSAGTLLCQWFKTTGQRCLPLLGIPPELPGHIPWPEQHSLDALGQLDSRSNRNLRINIWREYAITDVIREFLTKRINSLNEKIGRMQTLHRKLTQGRRGDLPLSTRVVTLRWIHSKGIPIPKSVLHSLSAVEDIEFTERYSHLDEPSCYLPITHVLQGDLMKLILLSDRLEDADPNDIRTLDPKEYVPDITTSKYFSTYQVERQRRSSSLALEVLDILLSQRRD